MAPAIRKDAEAFKRTFRATDSVRASALAAGYSIHTANTGLANLPAKLVRYVERKRSQVNKYTALASSVDAQTQEALTRGRLIANVVDGKDAACNSLKMLGQDKRVNMFAADSQAHVVLIQPPASVMESLLRALPVETQIVEPDPDK